MKTTKMMMVQIPVGSHKRLRNPKNTMEEIHCLIRNQDFLVDICKREILHFFVCR